MELYAHQHEQKNKEAPREFLGVGPESPQRMKPMVEERSFEELYDEYFDKVNRYLRYRVKSHWDADDLTTTVFIKAFEKIEQYNQANSFAAWIFRIAHNTYVDYLRKKKDLLVGENEHVLEPTDDQYNPEVQALSQEMTAEMFDLLEQLPTAQRDVLTLRYFGDLKLSQIAEVLGKSDSAVKMISHRGLQQLRRIYEKSESYDR